MRTKSFLAMCRIGSKTWDHCRASTECQNASPCTSRIEKVNEHTAVAQQVARCLDCRDPLRWGGSDQVSQWKCLTLSTTFRAHVEYRHNIRIVIDHGATTAGRGANMSRRAHTGCLSILLDWRRIWPTWVSQAIPAPSVHLLVVGLSLDRGLANVKFPPFCMRALAPFTAGAVAEARLPTFCKTRLVNRAHSCCRRRAHKSLYRIPHNCG